MRHIATVCDDGSIRVIQEEIPNLGSGMVLVKVHSSLVSPGTELGGWKTLRKLRKAGTSCTVGKKFGYSNAGIVEEVGKGVSSCKKGDRIACIGYGYALHSDWAVVPQNLCVSLPESVSFDDGSYAMLLATAMQSVRRCQPELGEQVAVVGMGLVGQLTAQLHQVAGNSVIGWARHPRQMEAARLWGIDHVLDSNNDDIVEQTRRITNEYGLDAAVLAFAGKAGEAWNQICSCMKKSPDGHLMGRIVVVGGTALDLNWIPANLDIRIAARTGPGYHDTTWEFGSDYPSVFMRWTTKTNLELCMALLEKKKIQVNCLTTHRVSLLDAQSSIDAILDSSDEILGLVFTN